MFSTQLGSIRSSSHYSLSPKSRQNEVQSKEEDLSTPLLWGENPPEDVRITIDKPDFSFPIPNEPIEEIISYLNPKERLNFFSTNRNHWDSKNFTSMDHVLSREIPIINPQTNSIVVKEISCFDRMDLFLSEAEINILRDRYASLEESHEWLNHVGFHLPTYLSLSKSERKEYEDIALKKAKIMEDENKYLCNTYSDEKICLLGIFSGIFSLASIGHGGAYNYFHITTSLAWSALILSRTIKHYSKQAIPDLPRVQELEDL